MKRYSLRFLLWITTAAAVIAFSIHLGSKAAALALPAVLGIFGAVAWRISFVRSWMFAALGIAAGLFVAVVLNAFVVPLQSSEQSEQEIVAREAIQSFVMQTWFLQAVWFLICGAVLGLFAATVVACSKGALRTYRGQALANQRTAGPPTQRGGSASHR